MVVTKYLPEISVTGRYINEDKNPLFNNSKIETSYYNYGFKVSLAININSYRDIESSKIDYIKAKISLEEQKKRVENRYYLVKKRLEIIDQKIALSIDDAQNYANMLRVAREKEMAGDSTSYDTKIVENSLRVRELDQDIYRYDIELELLSLYENVEGVLELGR
jgi:outer membrane protein TolC